MRNKIVEDLILVVENYIEKYRLLPVTRLVAGVSGGADSMALLFVLKDILSRKYPEVPLLCAHVNHGIREEAGRDEKVVEAFCAHLQVPFLTRSVCIPEVAEREGLSLETAGRIARYDFFRELAGDEGTIAVAHHMEDQAESVAMHIFRGCGLEGLCGIRPRNGNVIHPFLCLRKEQILRFCEEKGIPYCHDVTNDDPSYDRNFWRKEVFPLIRKGTDRNPVSALNGLAERVSEESAFLDEMARERLDAILSPEAGGKGADPGQDAPAAGEEAAVAGASGAPETSGASGVPVLALMELKRPLRRRVLRLLALRTWGDVVDIEESHWDAILRLVEKPEGGGHLDLPGGRSAERERGCIRFLSGARDPSGEEEKGGYVVGTGFLTPSGWDVEEVRLRDLRDGEVRELLAVADTGGESGGEAPGEVPVGAAGEATGEPSGEKVNFSQRFGRIRLHRIVKEEPLIYNDLTWFFPESLLENAVIRTRRQGDRFSRAGSSCTKQLRRYMNELGIPPRFRDRVILLAEGDRVLWIPGWAHAEGFTDAESERRCREDGQVLRPKDRAEEQMLPPTEQAERQVLLQSERAEDHEYREGLLCLEFLPSDIE